jgi:hypothetical protein
MVQADIEPNADYFLDLWGTCSMTKFGKPYCFCNDSRAGGVWIGRGCVNWTPLGVTSNAEHLKWFMSHVQD